jgi:MFS family permease
LLFADHGLSATQISSLLIIWSATSFLFEVPSGAWADIVDRRVLLALSGPIYAGGFVLWTLWPAYPGFALGFVLWGLSSAFMSGTFEAFLYDELVVQGHESSYARVLGWTNGAEVVATMVGIAAGGPLYAWGGYRLVGAASVLVALVHGAVAWSLPGAPRQESADETIDGGSRAGVMQRYVAMLRAGVSEATRRGPVRHILLITGVLMGVTAYDEYFPLLAREQGAATADVPILMAVVTAGQVVGAALAGRAERLAKRTLAFLVAAAGVAIAAGALAGHPAGIVAVAVGYGITHNVTVVAEARLQSAITGPARATVTSAMGFGAEVFAIACYGIVAIGGPWWSIGVLLAIMCTPLLGIAGAIRAWWPAPSAATDDSAVVATED